MPNTPQEILRHHKYIEKIAKPHNSNSHRLAGIHSRHVVHSRT